MAVDTANKRASAVNVASPWRGLLPLPDGTVDQADRQHAAFMYRGILAVASTLDTFGGAIVMTQFPYHELSRPVAVNQPWQTVITAGGMDDADNAGSDITNPDTQISGADHLTIKVNKRGTFLQVRLVYDDALSSITDPVVQLFGRFDTSEQWQRLRSLSENVDVPVVTAPALDVTDGTLKYTDPDYLDQTIDLDATDEVVIGIKTALSATGDVTTATLQAKLIGGIRTF